MVKDLIAEAERLEILEQAPFVAGGCLFTGNILNEIDEYKLLLTRVNPFSSLLSTLHRSLFVLVVREERQRTKISLTRSGNIDR